MADSEHDDEFEAYLKRRVPIDQRMKTVDRLEPPPELDRLIIGKARNAIQNSPQVPMYRAPKWALPVGLAATLLIAFSIVLDLGIRSSRHQQAQSAPAPAVTQASAGAASEPRVAAAAAPALANELESVPAGAPTVPSASARQSASPPRSSEPTASAAPAAAGAGNNTVASAKAFARMRPPPIKTAPWPPLRRAEKPAAPADAASSSDFTTAEFAAGFDPRSRSAERRVAETRIRTDDSQRVAAADVGSPAAPDATSVGAPIASAAAAPAAPPPRPLVDATANAGAPVPLRLAAAAPEAATATFDSVKVTGPRSAERLNSVSGGGPATRAAAPAAASPVAGSAAAGSPAADRREHPDPKIWLDQIQKLRVAGLTAQAEQELKHFRDAYPGYSVTEQ